ncbi:MAG: VanW family protein, partial [Pseudonocardia sp.]|nr:VanW family protein [Pseudonocardia sp.]
PGDAPTVAVRVTGSASAAPSARPGAQPGRPVEGQPWLNAWDADATQRIRRPSAGAPVPPADPATDLPTQRIPTVAAGAYPGPARPGGSGPARPGGAPGGSRPRLPRRRLLIAGAVVAVLALFYIGDLVLSSGAVPRGVSVAGVQVGGLGTAAAEQRLREEIEPRTTLPVAVTVGEASSEIDPATAGLAVDWTGTLDQAGSQPLNPITRITSFFTRREVGVVTTTDRAALDSALEELAPVVDTVPTEGAVKFEDTKPVAVEPVPGQRLDQPAAAEVLERQWADGATVALPLVELPPTTTAEQVTDAIEKVATPAVAGPVTVIGENGIQASLTPEDIAEALSFRADPGAGLVPEINQEAVTDALTPQLRSTERPGRDATLDFSSGAPVIAPSQDGRGVDYEATLTDLLTVLTESVPRQITAVYADQTAEVTTEEIGELGITGVIGEFQTGGFATDSGQNIKRAAEVIDGMIVQPGETFSLNAATSPRNASNGYVEAGIIDNGQPGRGVGGGVSQVATTLYNAAYFAGMVDVEHKEHSFYISRYPPGREATVFEGSIDLKWRNDGPTGVLIDTTWTPSTLTVRLFGTKRYDVTSETGGRTRPTNPNTVTVPVDKPCNVNAGSPGFTISDVRVLRNLTTGEVRREPRTVQYNPIPIVVCAAG